MDATKRILNLLYSIVGIVIVMVIKDLTHCVMRIG